MKAKQLTIDKLRTYKGLESLSDEEAEEIIKSLDALAGIAISHIINSGITTNHEHPFYDKSETAKLSETQSEIEPKSLKSVRFRIKPDRNRIRKGIKTENSREN